MEKEEIIERLKLMAPIQAVGLEEFDKYMLAINLAIQNLEEQETQILTNHDINAMDIITNAMDDTLDGMRLLSSEDAEKTLVLASAMKILAEAYTLVKEVKP